MKTYTFSRCISVFLTISLLFILPSCKKKEKTKETQSQLEKTEQIPEEIVQERQQQKKLRKLTILTYPVDSQSTRSLDQDIIVYFSRAVNPGDFSYAISPDPGEWEAIWSEGNRKVFLKHKTPFSAAEQYEMEIVVKSENLRKTIQFIAYGPSMQQKIEEDEKKGLIDFDTAWLYHLQALFEPEKLPSKYRSPTPIYCGTGIMQDFQQIADKLKPQTLLNLKPYLVRPDHPESIYANKIVPLSDSSFNGGFHLHALADEEERPSKGLAKDPLLCKTGPISIWYMKGHIAKAEESRDYLDMGNYYGKFKNLLGKEPLSDGNLENKGRDGRLDIYIVPISASGLCISLQGGRTAPALIKIDVYLEGADLDTTLAHELFHAFQFAFDQREERWWLESTAVWAEDYSDSIRNREWDHLEDAFHLVENRLQPLTGRNGKQEYGMYLFPLYLKQEFGAGKIAEIWEACETTGALDAVDKNVSKGIEECFKHFALLNLDLGPHTGFYNDHQGPLKLYDYHGALDFPLYSVSKNSKKFSLPPLSARYIIVEHLFDPDDTPPFVHFDLGDFAKNDKITIQAIIDPEGEAKEEDWSNLSERTFCINLEEEYFEKIALVIASSERENFVSPELEIEVKDEGCEADWSGTFTFSIYDHTKDTESFEWGSEVTQTDIDEKGNATLVFFYDDEYGDFRCRSAPGGSYISSYKEERKIATKDGQGRTVWISKCSGSYDDEGPEVRCFLSLIGDEYQLSIALTSDPDRACDGTKEEYLQGSLTDSHEFTKPFVLTVSFFGETDGKTIVGSQTDSDEGYKAMYNWRLHARKKK